MSSRFHNKYHRHNHHSVSVNDPRYPDASHDPIASPESPYLGDFVMIGSLTATASPDISQLSATTAGSFYAETGIGIYAKSLNLGLKVENNAQIIGTLSASDIAFTGNVLRTFNEPVTALGEFLEVVVNGLPRAIRLWQYE
jgi:hypothetical protein